MQITPLKRCPRPTASSLGRGSLFLYLWKKGAPILQFRITLIITVSIHAPLKGATAEAIDLINRGTIAPFLREQMYYKKESTRIMLGNMLES